MVRVSSLFYYDHIRRDLDRPPILRENKWHVWIDPAHPASAELLSDAYYYANAQGFDFTNQVRIINGAKQTVRALLKAGLPHPELLLTSREEEDAGMESDEVTGMAMDIANGAMDLSDWYSRHSSSALRKERTARWGSLLIQIGEIKARCGTVYIHKERTVMEQLWRDDE